MLRKSCLLVALVALCAWPSAAQAATPLVASPSDPRSFTWVEEDVLAVGGGGLTKQQVDWLYDQGFRAIASFRAEHEDPADYIRGKGMEYLYMPVDHAVNINVTHLKQFVLWSKAQEAAGRPMYIHCTNGWHRAAAFAVAWEMERTGGTYDAEADKMEDLRPGTVMRAPGPLLAYESYLTGKPGLTVLLQSPLSRPERNGTMPVTVEVLAGGVPLAGATVEVWSEESRLGFKGKTDAQGRYAFTYTGNVGNFPVDHLYARASASGWLDGADNVELFYVNPVNPAPLQLEATWTPQGIEVDVRKHGVHAVASVVATAPGGWSHVERAFEGETFIPLPPGGGPVTLRAERWGSEGAKLVVDGKAPAAPPTPPPKAEPAPPKAQPQPKIDPDQHGGAIRAKDAPPEVNRAPLPESLQRPVEVTRVDPQPEPEPAPWTTARMAAMATGGLLVLAATALLLRRRGAAQRHG